MAFPYIFSANWEQGTNGEWDSETDTGSRLDFPHVSTLAGISGIGPAAPFRGAFCMRIVLGDANDHTLIEGDIDIADTVTRSTRFMFYLGDDFAFTADDTFNIYEVQGTADAVENAVGLRCTAATNLIEIGVGQVAPTTFGTPPLVRNRWYAIELTSVIQTLGTGTGTVFVDGQQYAQITTLTNTAVLRGVLGSQNTLSTTTGTLLFDEFVFDDLRVYPIVDRYPREVLLTKSGHVCVGPGELENVSLLSGGGTNNVLTVYDTNRGNTNDAYKVGVELKNVTANDIVDPAGMPVQFRRGCYVSLTGTDPRALVRLGRATAYGSAGAVRTVASRLRLNPLEVL